MGEIFLATLDRDGGFRKLVIVKRLLSHLADDPSFVAMFLDEARLAARLSHPNVCQIYELGSAGGRHYMAMEYLHGASLRHLLRVAARRRQYLDLRFVAGILQGVCEGLHHAHEAHTRDGGFAGVVHRDVSPSNLFLTSLGVPKVLDFGVAKARDRVTRTLSGQLKGKFAYMSPEQIQGQSVDRRSDIFALGVVMFEALTASPLFARSSDFLTYKAILEDPIPRLDQLRPSVPRELAAAVARALARPPGERYATAREMGQAVAAAVHELGGPMGQLSLAREVERSCADLLAARRALVARVERGEELDGDSFESALADDIDAQGDASPSQVATWVRARAGGHPPGAEQMWSEPPGTPTRSTVAPAAAAGRTGARPRRRRRFAIAGALVLAGIASTLGALAVERPGAPGTVPAVVGAGEVVVIREGDAFPPGGSESPLRAPARGLAERGGGDAGAGAALSALFTGQRRGAIARCFLLAPSQALPPIIISFELEADGSVRSAAVRPAEVASTPVGGCLHRAALATRFGRQEHRRFSIPIELTRSASL